MQAHVASKMKCRECRHSGNKGCTLYLHSATFHKDIGLFHPATTVKFCLRIKRGGVYNATNHSRMLETSLALCFIFFLMFKKKNAVIANRCLRCFAAISTTVFDPNCLLLEHSN